jgi:hypothetical protein
VDEFFVTGEHFGRLDWQAGPQVEIDRSRERALFLLDSSGYFILFRVVQPLVEILLQFVQIRMILNNRIRLDFTENCFVSSFL